MIATAAAVAGIVAAAPAAAQFPGPDDTRDIEVYFSGATALDGSLENFFSNLCVSGTLAVFRDDGGTPPPGNLDDDDDAQRAFFCTVDDSQITGGLTITNPEVLFHKRSSGGSVQGVFPVASRTAIEFLVVSGATCDLVGTSQPPTNDPNIQEWRCRNSGAGLQNVIPDGGISDVEPQLFVDINVATGQSAITDALVAELDVNSSFATVFGIPATNGLVEALQEAQNLTVGTGAANYSAANMPSLSRRQFASLYTGRLRNWNQLQINGTPLTTFATNPPTANDGFDANFARICRRVRGSGTQAQNNAKIAARPCVSGAVAPLEFTNPVVGPVVQLNSGSGDVDDCLQAFADAGSWAIGLQSTERNDIFTTSNGGGRFDYEFLRIDNVVPDIANAANGDYIDFVESTIQWRNDLDFIDLANADNIENIFETIVTNAANPTEVAGNNASFVQPWGQGGLLALAGTVDAVFDPANPVTAYTAAPQGFTNNCVVPVVKTGVAFPLQ